MTRLEASGFRAFGHVFRRRLEVFNVAIVVGVVAKCFRAWRCRDLLLGVLGLLFCWGLEFIGLCAVVERRHCPPIPPLKQQVNIQLIITG